jgi:uncharacterized membrane protein (UPF0127 family)
LKKELLTCLFAMTVALVACARSDANSSDRVVTFDTGSVTIKTPRESIRVPVELARTETEQQYGLMDRPSLDPERGMLFAYNAVQDTGQGFWMFRTKIPLDIAFIDSAGTIVAIRSMEPCQSPQPEWCPAYSPGKRYQSALEANRGFFSRHGIAEGALVQKH